MGKNHGKQMKRECREPDERDKKIRPIMCQMFSDPIKELDLLT